MDIDGVETAFDRPRVLQINIIRERAQKNDNVETSGIIQPEVGKYFASFVFLGPGQSVADRPKDREENHVVPSTSGSRVRVLYHRCRLLRASALRSRRSYSLPRRRNNRNLVPHHSGAKNAPSSMFSSQWKYTFLSCSGRIGQSPLRTAFDGRLPTIFEVTTKPLIGQQSGSITTL